MKKKMLAVILTLTMVVSLLGGCGSKNGKEDGDKKGTTPTSGAAATEAPKGDDSQAEQAEPVELTVWGWDASFNGLALQEADKLNDGATVNFVEMAKGDCLQKIHTVLASGVTDDLPDIVIISDLVAPGYLMSYPGAFYAMDGVLNYDAFASYKKAAVSYGGVGYGVPFDTGVAGLFYRTDYIQEAGYTDEDMQNLTWEEYQVLGQKLKEKGHLLQTYNPNDIAEFQIMLQSAGTWFTNEDGSPNFANNEALKECYQIFKNFNESDYVKVVSDWTGFAGAINGGDVACVIRGSWIASTIKAAQDQSGLWKVAPVPTLSTSGASNKSNQGGSSWFVLNNSKNAAAAADFLAKTFGQSTDLYNTLVKEKNIMATYLPASNVEAYNTEDPFFSGTKINQALASWIAEIPAVNTGAYSAEAQAALLAVTPDILAGSDLNASLQKAEEQFSQTIQE